MEHGALSIRPKIPEIPGEERMERTFSGISFRNFRCTSRACPNIPENRNNRRRFPFDQKFRIFRVEERMEQTFSGVSFRNFGCTSRGWPKIPENRNNRKILFYSSHGIPEISFRNFLLNGKRPWSTTNNKRSVHRYFHSDQCCPQVLFDVLWVCQPGLCVAVAAQDAKLETTIQVLPLVRWIVYVRS